MTMLPGQIDAREFVFWKELALEMMKNYAVDERVIAHAMRNAGDRAGIDVVKIGEGILAVLEKGDDQP